MKGGRGDASTCLASSLCYTSTPLSTAHLSNQGERGGRGERGKNILPPVAERSRSIRGPGGKNVEEAMLRPAYPHPCATAQQPRQNGNLIRTFAEP